MELIKKKISLNSLLNRYVDGKAVLGNDFLPGSLHGVDIPVGENGYVRFGTARAYVSWLRKFFTESRLYRYCMKHSEHYWRDEGPAGSVNGCSVEIKDGNDEEIEDVSGIQVVSSLPEESETGTYAILSDSAETFLEIFGNLSDAIAFYEDFCEKLTANEGIPGYFDIHLLLTEKYEDLGKFIECGEREENIKHGTSEPKVVEHGFSAFTDSKLSVLKRATMSYDIDGNELPFFLDGNDTALPYNVGNPRNVRLGDSGECYYDRVIEVHFENEEGEHGQSKREGNVKVSDADKDPIISITYEIGRSVDEDGNETEGIVRTEKYYYKVVTGRFNVSGFSSQYEYIDIDYDTIVETGNPFVSYTEVTGNEDITAPTNYIFDEALAGMHDYSESVSKVNIERGSSASFEPLNLMGQFSSVEEIERYSGDLFKIGAENN